MYQISHRKKKKMWLHNTEQNASEIRSSKLSLFFSSFKTENVEAVMKKL